MSNDHVTFDLGDGVLRWQDKVIELSPQQAALLGVLHKRAPLSCSVQRIVAEIWPMQEPADLNSSVRVQIYHLRKRLKGLPLEITARWGYGYRLAGPLVMV